MMILKIVVVSVLVSMLLGFLALATLDMKRWFAQHLAARGKAVPSWLQGD